MILAAPTSAAAWMAFRPTPPQPSTTTLDPGDTRARLTTAPAPAATPQLTRHTTSRGASFRIEITDSSGRTARAANEEIWRKW